jgi:DNA-binding Xre family transcriptional regulator
MTTVKRGIMIQWHENKGVYKCMVRLRIKEVAQAKGYTQNSLSRATDISLNTIRRLWNKPYSGVTAETLHKIARVLKVDISELTTYEDD